MNAETFELLMREEATLNAVLGDAARLADGAIITLHGCASRNEFVELDLTAIEVTIRRLKELQRSAIEKSRLVGQMRIKG